MKYDLALFRQLNEEYRDRPLVPTPPVYDPASLADRGRKRADALVAKHRVAGRTLEIGCGRGEVSRALAVHHGCETVGVDLKAYPEWADPPPGVRLLAADLSAADTPDLGRFDFIYSNAVFEHVRHPYGMLRKAIELLRPGGRMYLSANLYRGPKASHRYREVFFPWPHLLFSDEVFAEYYVSIGKPPARAAWVNQLSIADYCNYFNLIGFELEGLSFSKTPIDEPFYRRFADKLERIPRFDLERDFLIALLKRPADREDTRVDAHQRALLRRFADKLARIPRFGLGRSPSRLPKPPPDGDRRNEPQVPNPSEKLTAGDRETLGFHGVQVHRDYAAGIAALAGRGFVPPGRGLPPQPFRLPFDWSADPLKDGNWMFHIHAWRMLDPHLCRLLAEPGHPRAFADILEVIADWHRGNVRNRPGPFSWYDMATGLRGLKLALLGWAAELRGHVFDDPGLIADLVARHVAELSRPEGLGWNNHGLFQLSGLKALLWQYPDQPGADAARAYATERMVALIDSQLGPEGVHTEHSPDYHFYALTAIGSHLKAPWWQLDAIAALREKLAAAGRARYWLVDPAGRCLPVGDSGESIMVKDFAGLERWPHQRRNGALGAVLDGYGVVRADPAMPVARSAMLFLTASFHSHVHKHADCLSLIWQEAGENLLIDSGKYGYQSGAMRAHFVSTCAHNTIEVDGRSFSRKKEDAYGSGIRTVAPLDQTWLIEAEARHGAEGILHRRGVFFRPHWFLLAVDHVAADRPRRRTFTAWWHFNPNHAVSAEPDQESRYPVSGLAGGGRLFVSHVGSGADPRVELHRGALEPRIQGWVSRAYLKSEPATALGFSGRSGGDFVAATLFELAGPGAAPRLGLRREPSGRIALSDGSGGQGFAVDLDLDIAPGFL